MVYLYAFIFILSLGAGYGFARLNAFSPVQQIMSIAVAGFIGSSIIALMFSFLYFFRQENDTEKIERLQQEVARLKQRKEIKRIE